MNKSKKNIYNDIIKQGRNLIIQNGCDKLTARKLAKETNYSVGTIYNNFKNLDNYITIQNTITLNNLYDELSKKDKENNIFNSINKKLSIYINFISKNKNLWELLFNFHNNKNDKISFSNKKMIFKIYSLINKELYALTARKNTNKIQNQNKIIITSLFTNSSFLLQNNNFENLEKNSKYLLNTYLAGIIAIKK